MGCKQSLLNKTPPKPANPQSPTAGRSPTPDAQLQDVKLFFEKDKDKASASEPDKAGAGDTPRPAWQKMRDSAQEVLGEAGASTASSASALGAPSTSNTTYSMDSARVGAHRLSNCTSAMPLAALPKAPSLKHDTVNERSSIDSTGRNSVYSNRSSFAAEVPVPPRKRGSAEGNPGKTSPVVLPGQAVIIGRPSCAEPPDPLTAFVPPEGTLEAYTALGVVPAETPMPLAVLQELWGLASVEAVQQLAQPLVDLGVLRLAVLEDGSTWALPGEDHLIHINRRYGAQLGPKHMALLQGYSQGGKLGWASMVDDGYILQALSHHLVAADRFSELRALLLDPAWLEGKLHAYGIGAVVTDFRRYLQQTEDSDVKLLLQAFQLSLGAAMEHPSSHMLREQMLARLMAVAQAGPLKEWYAAAVGRCSADSSRCVGQRLLHLMPRTPTLIQAGGVHRMTLRGHTKPIRKVVISPNGQDVITISDDGTAQIWDMNIGDCMMQLCRDAPLTAVGVAPDSQMAVVGAADGTACIWDLQAGVITHNLSGHTAKITALAIDRQGIRCVTASDDGTARVWSIFDGKCEAVMSGHGAVGPGSLCDVAISSDGTLAATVSEDFSCRVWDLDEDGDCLHTLEGHSGWVVSCTFVGTTHNLVTASHDTTARVWNALRGTCQFVLSGHTGRLNRVVVDAGGTWAVTASDDYSARVWDLDTGVCLAVLGGHAGWVNDAAITRDGASVITVSGDHSAAIWDVASAQRKVVLEGHSGEVRSLVLTFKGRFAVTASDDCTARVWDLQAQPSAASDAHGGKVHMLKCVPGGAQVVSTGDDGTVILWEVAHGACLQRKQGHRSGARYLGVSDDGHTAVSGSGDRKVCLWTWTDEGAAMQAETGMDSKHNSFGSRQSAEGMSGGEDEPLRHALPEQQGSRVKHMTFDASCQLAAVLLYDSTVAVWDVKKGTVVAQLIKRGDRDHKRVHSGGVNAVYLTRDGKIAITISKDCTARVWDVVACECSRVISGHTDGLLSAALSHDETLLATSAYDKTVRISRMKTGESIAVLDHAAPPIAMAFSPDGSRLAVVIDDNSVVVWDLTARSCLPPLTAHTNTVLSLLWAPTSAFLLTTSQDCTLRVWRARDGEQAAFFMADAAITACCFAGQDEAEVIVAGDVGGMVHFLDIPHEMQQ